MSAGPWGDAGMRFTRDAEAIWLDGERAVPRLVHLAAGPEGVMVRHADGRVVTLPPRSLRVLPDQPKEGFPIYASAQGARLVPRHMAANARLRTALGGAAPPRRGLRRAVLLAVGAGAVLAGLIAFALPSLANLFAQAMDPRAERALGEIHFDQTRLFFGGGVSLPVCADPAGVAALEALTDRVAAGTSLPYDLEVVVLDDGARPILNAYAVAGGRITFFDTMIQEAESPEEIAAVLAHELGHVAARDPVRGLLQGASVGLVAGVLVGDVTSGGLLGAGGAAALTAGYSRDAEARADAFARDVLVDAGLPPSALGRMFERLLDRYGEAEGILSHFASHPDLAGRIAASADVDPADTRPALTEAQWVALLGICDTVVPG